MTAPRTSTAPLESVVEAHRDAPDAPSPNGPATDALRRERDQLLCLGAGHIRQLLVKHGIIQAHAVDDPEGYDGHATWDAVNRFATALKAEMFPVQNAAACFDCGIPYPFGLDLVLPDQQWKHLFPEKDGNGLLCPNCICKRAHELKGSTVVLAWIDRIDWSAPRPERWMKQPTEIETSEHERP